ncbi:glycosyltransferase family 4 protein [Hymenobacter negativus]|uniref:Glycosyltransferase family 4 protein n=1 Tax=Hymenobacter negativus TaxID=2795026 RepID=A0ABS3Q889_9BACT|nr:glycosyltransferase family 4 protein [Hymenobacter negativus]MBO2007459.1 glycosyltransferase family 4 protein [Hymenobacter negativus]
MHILQLCPRVPFPPHDGGAIAMYDVAAGLVQAGHRVTLLAINTPKHRQPADALAHLGPNMRLVTVEVDTDISAVRALKNYFFSRQPYNVERFISMDVLGKLAELLFDDQEEPISVVQFEGTFVAAYIELLRRGMEGTAMEDDFQIPLVLRAHNIENTIWHKLARWEKNPLKRLLLRTMATRLEKFERRYLRQFDAVAAITEADADRLRALHCPEPVVFIPAGVELSRVQIDHAIQSKQRTLFMIGSLDWLPNQEGVDWLLREVWPAFHAEFPEVELHIAGRNAPAHLLNLKADNVFMHGFVESAPAFMQQYGLMLVPLLSGGGMRVKIIEGMALGKAILSTGLGAEGIAVRDGHDIIVRDSPAEWLAFLRTWARGEANLGEIGTNAARTAADVYDNRRVVQRFVDLYERLLVPAPAGTPAHSPPA